MFFDDWITGNPLDDKHRIHKRVDLYQALFSAPKEDLETYQLKRLESLVRTADRNNPWWRSLLRGVKDVLISGGGISQAIAALPEISRETVQFHREEMLVRLPKSKPGDYGDVFTSGSTGKAVQVTKYRPEDNLETACSTLLNARLHGIDSSWDAFSIGNHENKDAGPMGPPHSIVGWKGKLTTRKVSTFTEAELLEGLAKSGARHLIANGNQIRLLALQQIRQPVSSIQLEVVTSWIDYVDQDLRDLVSQAFQSKIVNRYSCEEIGALAIQCPESNHLHAYSPKVYFEVTDEQGNPVPEGQLGRVKVTSFANHSMPLFRYELGDLATLSSDCSLSCWPVISEINGRIRDYITDEDGNQKLPRLGGLSIRKSPLLMDHRIYLFDDRAVLVVAPIRELTEDEISLFKEDLEYAFYLPPGHSEVVISFDYQWRSVWKRKVFERVHVNYSQEHLQRQLSS